MKKQRLKQLSLNKRAISNLQLGTIRGGENTDCDCPNTPDIAAAAGEGAVQCGDPNQTGTCPTKDNNDSQCGGCAITTAWFAHAQNN